MTVPRDEPFWPIGLCKLSAVALLIWAGNVSDPIRALKMMVGAVGCRVLGVEAMLERKTARKENSGLEP